jgi:quercetin dioxygenase-like cupin family protein
MRELQNMSSGDPATTKQSTQMADAFVRGANLATSKMYMGSIMSFLVRAQETDGRVVEYRARPGNEPPPHVHLWEHEIYFVLEGKIEFHCEDQVETVGPGETIFLPKGRHMPSISDPNIR